MTSSQLNKETILRQHGISVWLIGLSGSGKTTISLALEAFLLNKKYFAVVQDADITRKGVNSGLGYSIEDRKENIRRAAEVSKMLVENGIISINAFICPTEEMRKLIFQIIDNEKVMLVHVSTPIEICEKRDAKGLYSEARKGQLKDFTGVGASFEEPKNANISIDTSKLSIDTCVETIYSKLEPLIRIK